jgi:hypothetical protein
VWFQLGVDAHRQHLIFAARGTADAGSRHLRVDHGLEERLQLRLALRGVGRRRRARAASDGEQLAEELGLHAARLAFAAAAAAAAAALHMAALCAPLEVPSIVIMFEWNRR